MSDQDAWGTPAQPPRPTTAQIPPPAPVRKPAAKPAVSGTTIALVAGAFALGAVTVTLLARRSTAAQNAAPSASVTSAASPRQAPPVQRGDDDARNGWTGNKQAHWARDGSRTVTYQLSAEHDVRVWMKRVTPILAVRCLSGRTDVYVVTDSSASVEQDDRHTVRIGFDGEPDATQSWEESADGQALFAPDGMSFARKVAEARTLRFGFTPYNAAPVVVDFDVSGFDRLVGQVAKTCRWPGSATSPDRPTRHPTATAAVRE